MGNHENKLRLVFSEHPMADTAIGREQGYANDREFMAAQKAVLVGMPVSVQARVREMEQNMQRRFFFGDDAA